MFQVLSVLTSTSNPKKAEQGLGDYKVSGHRQASLQIRYTGELNLLLPEIVCGLCVRYFHEMRSGYESTG